MKKIIGLLLLLSPVFLFSQTVGELRYDTLKILKKGGSSELVLMNSTRDSLGVLTNIGGGKTRFVKSKIIGDSLIVIGVDTLKISPGQSVAGSDKQVQFNDGGALGAEAGFEYDKGSNTLKSDTLYGERLHLYSEDTIPQLIIEHPRDSANTNPSVLFKNNVGDTTLEIRATNKVVTNQTGSSLFIGLSSGANNKYSPGTSTDGVHNVGLGAYSLFKNTIGRVNTAIGVYALSENIDGSFNSAFGQRSLNNLTHGDNNIGFGQSTLKIIDSADWNVAIGTNAGDGRVRGNNNVFIGSKAGFADSNTGTGDGNVFIGYEAGQAWFSNVSNKLIIDNSPGPLPFLYGDFSLNELYMANIDAKFGIRTINPEQALHVKGQVKIDTLTTGSETDSLVVSKDGVLKKVARSSIGSLTLQDVTDEGNETTNGIYINPTVSGSSSDSSLAINTEWNTSGSPTALSVDVTNTASGTGSRLLKLMNGGVAKFEVYPTGFTDINTVSGENLSLRMKHNGVTQFTFGSNGNLGFGITPGARIHIRAGTASAQTAPLKFSTGVTQQTTLENGAVNYDGNNLFMTTNGVNHKIAFADSMPVSGSYTPDITTVSNLEYAAPSYFTYTKIDSIITVYGRVGYEPTTAAAATFRVTLPLSTYSLPTSVVGFGGSYGGYFCRVVGYATDAQEVEVTVLNGEISIANDLYFSFQYKIDYP